MQKTETWRATPLALVVTFVVAMLAIVLLSIGRASATALSQAMVRFDHMQTSTATKGMVCAKTSAVNGTEAKVVVAFPTGYTVSGTTSNWTTDTTVTGSWPAGAAAWPGMGTASAAAGQNVTFPSSDLTVSTLYCFNWTSTAAITTPSSANSNLSGTITTQTGASATIDTGNFSTAAITSESFTVNATVTQTFQFSLSGASDTLPTLSSSAVVQSSSPVSASVSTNAKNGWQVWANDSNSGLTSAAAANTISATSVGSNTTLSTGGSAGYVTGINTSNGTGSGVVSPATAYNNASTLGKGAGLDTTLRTMATSNGPNGGASVSFVNAAVIAATTPPATDYTDTITVVGAGLF
jgi:hypothetical protein